MTILRELGNPLFDNYKLNADAIISGECFLLKNKLKPLFIGYGKEPLSVHDMAARLQVNHMATLGNYVYYIDRVGLWRLSKGLKGTDILRDNADGDDKTDDKSDDKLDSCEPEDKGRSCKPAAGKVDDKASDQVNDNANDQANDDKAAVAKETDVPGLPTQPQCGRCILPFDKDQTGQGMSLTACQPFLLLTLQGGQLLVLRPTVGDVADDIDAAAGRTANTATGDTVGDTAGVCDAAKPDMQVLYSDHPLKVDCTVLSACVGLDGIRCLLMSSRANPDKPCGSISGPLCYVVTPLFLRPPPKVAASSGIDQPVTAPAPSTSQLPVTRTTTAPPSATTTTNEEWERSPAKRRKVGEGLTNALPDCSTHPATTSWRQLEAEIETPVCSAPGNAAPPLATLCLGKFFCVFSTSPYQVETEQTDVNTTRAVILSEGAHGQEHPVVAQLFDWTGVELHRRSLPVQRLLFLDAHNSIPRIGLSKGDDAEDVFIFTVSVSAAQRLELVHVSTFPGLAFIQAGREHKKYFSTWGASPYAVISEYSRYVFLYRMPTPGARYSDQVLLQIGQARHDASIYGLHVETGQSGSPAEALTSVWLLSEHHIYRYLLR